MGHQKETENGKETGKKLQGPNLAQVQRGKKKTFKGFLHKFFKVILILMIVILVVNVLIITGVYINHNNKLADERGYLQAPGEMVEVDGHKLHTVVTGNLEA